MVTIREAVIVTVVLLLFFLMAPLVQFSIVEAQYPFCNPSIEIDSPQPEAVYNTTSIPVKIVVLPWETGERFVDIYYTIDDGPNVHLNVTRYRETTNIYGYGSLDNLTNGYHTMKAYANDTQGAILSCLPNTFLVNTSSLTLTVPEFPLLTTPFLIIVIAAAGLVVYFKKHEPIY